MTIPCPGVLEAGIWAHGMAGPELSSQPTDELPQPHLPFLMFTVQRSALSPPPTPSALAFLLSLASDPGMQLVTGRTSFCKVQGIESWSMWNSDAGGSGFRDALRRDSNPLPRSLSPSSSLNSVSLCVVPPRHYVCVVPPLHYEVIPSPQPPHMPDPGPREKETFPS